MNPEETTAICQDAEKACRKVDARTREVGRQKRDTNREAIQKKHVGWESAINIDK